MGVHASGTATGLSGLPLYVYCVVLALHIYPKPSSPSCRTVPEPGQYVPLPASPSLPLCMLQAWLRRAPGQGTRNARAGTASVSSCTAYAGLEVRAGRGEQGEELGEGRREYIAAWGVYNARLLVPDPGSMMCLLGRKGPPSEGGGGEPCRIKARPSCGCAIASCAQKLLSKVPMQ